MEGKRSVKRSESSVQGMPERIFRMKCPVFGSAVHRRFGGELRALSDERARSLGIREGDLSDNRGAVTPAFCRTKNRQGVPHHHEPGEALPF
jgi:hypothetical protein